MDNSCHNVRIHWYMASWMNAEMKLKMRRIEEKGSSRFFEVLELASDAMFRMVTGINQ